VIGEVIGNYRVVAELGKGGMGVVYRAEHVQLGRPAALKMLLPQFSSDQGIVQRFFNEARAASAIDHPGIVEIYDFGTHRDGRAYIVMEMLKGESLEHRLVSGPLPPQEGATILAQTAAALSAAHQRGIVHRDLKPDNIFLVPNELVPGGVQVKLLDFGIAKLADEKTAGFKTQTGAMMGTPAYMSPEQCMGKADLDHRTDIYSLGCILFHVLCGRPPFTSDEGTGMMIAAHIRDAAPDPRTVNPSVPADLAAIILRCLEKEPSARFQNAADLRNALVHAGANAPLSKPPAAAMGYDATIAPSTSPSKSPPSAIGYAPTSAPPSSQMLGTAPTTLGGSAAQMTPAQTMPPPKKSKAGLVAMIVGVAAAAGVAGFALTRSGGEKKTDVVAAKGPELGSAAPVAAADAAVAPLGTPEGEKPAPNDGLEELKKVECTDGKVTNVDTRGHCCWADQVWSEAKSKCLGVPTCPPGMKLKGEACTAVVAAAVKPPPHGDHPVVTANVPQAAVPIFTVDAKSYGPNEPITITFGHPVSSAIGAQAWVTVSDKGAAETSYGNWDYVKDGATTAELKAPKRPGDYEVRIHTDYPTKSYNVRYRVPITVRGKPDKQDKQDVVVTDGTGSGTGSDTTVKGPADLAPTPLDKQKFSLARKNVKVGGEAVLHFQTPLHAAKGERFWITIVPKDAPADKYNHYEYVEQDAKTARISVPAEPGDYEVRLHANYPTKTTNVVHRARLHVE
jgi:serine/threonine-protein kinase